MSLIRRRRRLQRRVLLQNTPDTRATRFAPGDVNPRGWRFQNRFQSPATPRTNLVINRELNPFYVGFNRDLKQVQLSRRLDKVRLSEPVKKPLTTIRLDGKIITDLPSNHPVCVSRRNRRAVLFATGKSGKSGQRPRRHSGEILRCEK